MVCLCLLVLVVCLVGRFSEYRARNLVLTFWDVGQGDSISIHFPTGEMMLIDAPGGYGMWNSGEKVVLPEILRQGVQTLNMVATHPDRDHAGGLLPIADALNVQHLYFNRVFQNDPIVRRLVDRVIMNKGEVHKIYQKGNRRFGDANLEWIVPSIPRSRKTNNHSLVLLLSYRGCNVLLTGDIEARAERAILSRIPPLDLLKVAHHGSKTSSSDGFIGKALPVLSVISAGWRNPYGHPHAIVTERLQRFGSRVFRTDVDGFIQMAINERGWIECESWHGPCGSYRCSGSSRSMRFKEFSRSRNSAAFSN